MTSIVRPTSGQMTRRLIVLFCAIFAVAVGWSQQLLGWGQSPAEFSADSDRTLRVAGYAFSIWGLIYLALLAYAVRQALPSTGESGLLRRLGWPSAAALAGIGLWVIAAGWDMEAATVILIFGSALVLIVPMLMWARDIRALGPADRERWLVAWPLGLLAGWLTVASPVNLLTVLTGNGDLPAVLSPTGWAVVAVLAVTVVAVLVTWRLRLMAYPLPIVWGLIAVFVAEQDRNPPAAFTALAAALAILIAAVVMVFRLRRGVERRA